MEYQKLITCETIHQINQLNLEQKLGLKISDYPRGTHNTITL